MGVEFDPQVHIPQSTGAVPFNDDYQRPIEQLGDDELTGMGTPRSTGAVEFQSPGTTVMPFDPEEVVVRSPAPGPIVMNQWPNAGNTKAMKSAEKDAKKAQGKAQEPGKATAKVVEPQATPRPAKKTSRAQTK